MAKLTMKELETRIQRLEDCLLASMDREGALLDRVAKLEAQPKAKTRDYGPASQVKLDDLTAWRIRFGDRSGFKVKDNAEFFGLSRGQVYSLDKYTFQHVTEDSFTEDDIPVEIAELEENDCLLNDDACKDCGYVDCQCG